MSEDEPASVLPPDHSSRGMEEDTGHEMGRVLSLSDGIFAFAMTLLVLSLTIPALPKGGAGSESGWLAAYLQGHLLAFFSYGLGFVIIGVWWVIHHRTFSYIVRYDRRLMWLNLAFLMLVAITPFPIGILTTFGVDQTSVAFFAGIQAVSGVLLAGIWLHASHGKRLVRPDLDDRLIAYHRWRTLASPLIFLASIGLTFVSPGLAMASWFFLSVGQAGVRQRVVGNRSPPPRGGPAEGSGGAARPPPS